MWIYISFSSAKPSVFGHSIRWWRWWTAASKTPAPSRGYTLPISSPLGLIAPQCAPTFPNTPACGRNHGRKPAPAHSVSRARSIWPSRARPAFRDYVGNVLICRSRSYRYYVCERNPPGPSGSRPTVNKTAGSSGRVTLRRGTPGGDGGSVRGVAVRLYGTEGGSRWL